MNPFEEKHHSARKSFFILILLTFGIGFATQLVAMIIGYFLGGGSLTSMMTSKVFLYFNLAASTVGMFLFPALVLQRMEPYYRYFPNITSQTIYGWVIAVIVFLFGFGPLMQWIGEANMQMSLPDSLKGLENWMCAQEDRMAEITQSIVMVDSVSLLFVNIFVMAVLPAIAEEFYFRGSLMHIIYRGLKNHHVAVWLTAIIFSAIHVQFFGFFPRMILGVFFGYMLLWTNNIWIPVLAHFVNNAAVAVIAFYYTKQGKTYADLQTYDDYSVWVYLGSFMLTVFLAVWSYKKLKVKEEYGERLEQNSNIL